MIEIERRLTTRVLLQEVPSYIPLETTHLCVPRVRPNPLSKSMLIGWLTAARRYLMGNKFSRVLPEMLVGYSLNDDGSFSSSTSPLPQLKVLCVAS
jgi:hypothetical protein